MRSVPDGFTYDSNSGLYYNEITGDDPKTGSTIKVVTWFYPDTGKFKQVVTPAVEEMPLPAAATVQVAEMPLPVAATAPAAEVSPAPPNIPPVKKKKNKALIAAIAAVLVLVGSLAGYFAWSHFFGSGALPEVTRGEWISMLVRADNNEEFLNLAKSLEAESPFEDVDETNPWHMEIVLAANLEWLEDDVEKEIFDPFGAATLEFVASTAMMALGYDIIDADEVNLTDIDSLSGQTRYLLGMAAQIGLIHPDENGKVFPTSQSTKEFAMSTADTVRQARLARTRPADFVDVVVLQDHIPDLKESLISGELERTGEELDDFDSFLASATLAAQLPVGAVFVIGDPEDALNGEAYKVAETQQQDDGRFKIITEDPEIEEVFEELDIWFSSTFADSDMLGVKDPNTGSISVLPASGYVEGYSAVPVASATSIDNARLGEFNSGTSGGGYLKMKCLSGIEDFRVNFKYKVLPLSVSYHSRGIYQITAGINGKWEASGSVPIWPPVLDMIPKTGVVVDLLATISLEGDMHMGVPVLIDIGFAFGFDGTFETPKVNYNLSGKPFIRGEVELKIDTSLRIGLKVYNINLVEITAGTLWSAKIDFRMEADWGYCANAEVKLVAKVKLQFGRGVIKDLIKYVEKLQAATPFIGKKLFKDLIENLKEVDKTFDKTMTFSSPEFPLGKEVKGHWEGENISGLWGWLTSKILKERRATNPGYWPMVCLHGSEAHAFYPVHLHAKEPPSEIALAWELKNGVSYAGPPDHRTSVTVLSGPISVSGINISGTAKGEGVVQVRVLTHRDPGNFDMTFVPSLVKNNFDITVDDDDETPPPPDQTPTPSPDPTPTPPPQGNAAFTSDMHGYLYMDGEYAYMHLEIDVTNTSDEIIIGVYGTLAVKFIRNGQLIDVDFYVGSVMELEGDTYYHGTFNFILGDTLASTAILYPGETNTSKTSKGSGDTWEWGAITGGGVGSTFYHDGYEVEVEIIARIDRFQTAEIAIYGNREYIKTETIVEYIFPESERIYMTVSDSMVIKSDG